MEKTGRSKAAARRFVGRREAVVEKLPWGPHHWLCRPGLVDARDLALVRVHMPPGKGHAFHRHPGMEEIIYVVEGKAEQWVDRRRRTLGPGEIAHIPRGITHATYNAGRKTLVFLAILSPARPRGPALVDMSGEKAWKRVRRGR